MSRLGGRQHVFKARRWEPANDRDLKTLVARDLSDEQIGEVMQRSACAVSTRRRRMRLQRPSTLGFRPKPIGHSQEHLVKALVLGSGDDRYVTACMDLGGFSSFVRLNDGRVIFGHAGKAWAQP